MKSPLQLERHFFTKVLLEAHPDGNPDVHNQVSCHVEIGTAVDDPKLYQVSMSVRLSDPKDGKKARYTGGVDAIGLFRVADGYPPERVKLLVENGGATLLYGAVRELVINVTSRGPWPPVTLCSMVFGVVKKPEPTQKKKVAAEH
jgi:preprotein translocase subunit SecB